MPFLLLIILMAACMPIQWPTPFWNGTPFQAILATAGLVFGILLASWILSRRTVLRLRFHSLSHEKIGNRYGQGRSILFGLSLFAFGFSLLELGWGWAVQDLLSIQIQNGEWIDLPCVRDLAFLPVTPPEINANVRWEWVPGTELAILFPFLLILFGSWLIFYDAERAFHEQDADADPETPFWSRWGYVLFRLRQFVVLVFVPIFLLITQQGLMRMYPDLSKNNWVRGLSLLTLPFFLIMLPMILPLLLGLKSMPTGRTRSRLEASATRLGFGYRQIYLWDTRKRMANAMVVGIVPWIRYVIFTDRLLDDLEDDEVDGVFGHEVGHAKHGHLVYYAIFLILSVLVVGSIYEVMQRTHWIESSRYRNWVLVAPVLFMGGYMFLVFGFLSRRCERQADIFGCRSGSCHDPKCDGHDEKTVLAPQGKGLCRTGIDAFIRALQRVESVNGMARAAQVETRRGLRQRLFGWVPNLWSWIQAWQHSTIEKRVAFLRRMAENPDIERRFQKRVFLIRSLILFVLISAILFLSLTWGSEVIWGAI